jgi:hypothetical protein
MTLKALCKYVKYFPQKLKKPKIFTERAIEPIFGLRTESGNAGEMV